MGNEQCVTHIAHCKYCGAMQSATSHSSHPDLQNNILQKIMYWRSNVRFGVRSHKVFRV